MKRIFPSLLSVLSLLSFLPLPLLAQAPQGNAIAAQREALKKLDSLAGQWKGEGWIERNPGQCVTFTQTENVQSKLGGTVLLVEGRGTGTGSGEGALFEAMAVISYDENAKRYRFVSNTSEGRQGEFELKPIEGGWEWGMSGRFRYTIKLTDKGQWYEIGEFSQDGKTWRKFHEMTLDRVR